MDSDHRMRYSMSPRCRPYVDILASRHALRYPVSDAQCDANDRDREPADLALSLHGNAQAGAAQAGDQWHTVHAAGAGSQAGDACGVLQRMVTDSPSDVTCRIGRPLVCSGAAVGRGTCVHVSDRRCEVDRASAGTGFHDGRVWEYQRYCGGQVGTC